MKTRNRESTTSIPFKYTLPAHPTAARARVFHPLKSNSAHMCAVATRTMRANEVWHYLFHFPVSHILFAMIQLQFYIVIVL